MDTQTFLKLVGQGRWEIGVRTPNGCERTYAPINFMTLRDEQLHIVLDGGTAVTLRADVLRFDGTNSTIRVKVSRTYRFLCPTTFGGGELIRVKPGKALFKVRRNDALPPKAARPRTPFEQAFDNYVAAAS